MITRRQDSHLVPIDSVVVEKATGLFVDFARTVLSAPQVKQLFVHGPRAHLANLSQVSKD